MSQVGYEERIIIHEKVFIGATIALPFAKNSIQEEKKYPAILVIMGTGKTDRDGNEKKFQTNFYKNLSDEFVKRGFVCIRYDKRGTFETEGDYNTSGLSDLVEDAVTVLRYIRNLRYVDEKRMILCGHSEGAMIATLALEQEKAAGMILLGGAGTSLKDALL